MNCNIFITRDLGLPIEGQPNYQAAKGEVFTGTANKGGVTFHVTMPNGKIHPVSLKLNDWRIEVEMFKNQTSV
jgi:hypothetical protein